MIHIDIANIPRKIVDFSTEAVVKLNELESDLNSGTVKAIEAYIPASTAVVEGAKTILETGISALQALKAIGDADGLKGRLLTLNTQLNNLETAGEHEWGTLVTWVQTVFNHWKKNK